MNIVILGSGRGSNARAILDAWKAGRLGKAEPKAILSDNPNAPILKLGRDAGITSEFIDPGKFKTRLTEEAEAAYVAKIRSFDPDLVVLAGFMRVIHQAFLDAFEGKIINLHPSLLPSFKGLNAIKQALDYGVRVTGCTVHYVNGELDGGPIIDQKVIFIKDGETLASLEEKMHQAEHELLPATIARLSLNA